MIMHCSVVTTLLGRFWHEPTIALCQPVPGCDSGHCTVQWLLPWCRWYGGFLWRGRDVSCDISFALKLRRRFPANVIYSMKRRLRFCLPSVWVLFFLAPSVFSEHLFLSFCPFFSDQKCPDVWVTAKRSLAPSCVLCCCQMFYLGLMGASMLPVIVFL